METQKYKIADLKGMTLQTINRTRSEFIYIDNIRFSDIPGMDIDIINGNGYLALTNDEFLDLIFQGETLAERYGYTFALFILDEPKKH
jgi:hypothetical protein